MNSGWIVFWGGLLGITLVAYAVLAVVVSIGALKDIRDMFRKLRGPDDDDEQK